MNKEKVIKSKLIDNIKKNASHFPFIAKKWEIYVKKIHNSKSSELEYGHYKTNSKNSIPFYKPISKIIDIATL